LRGPLPGQAGRPQPDRRTNRCATSVLQEASPWHSTVKGCPRPGDCFPPQIRPLGSNDTVADTQPKPRSLTRPLVLKGIEEMIGSASAMPLPCRT
jgi:hypothetical protein